MSKIFLIDNLLYSFLLLYSLHIIIIYTEFSSIKSTGNYMYKKDTVKILLNILFLSGLPLNLVFFFKFQTVFFVDNKNHKTFLLISAVVNVISIVFYFNAFNNLFSNKKTCVNNHFFFIKSKINKNVTTLITFIGLYIFFILNIIILT